MSVCLPFFAGFFSVARCAIYHRMVLKFSLMSAQIQWQFVILVGFAATQFVNAIIQYFVDGKKDRVCIKERFEHVELLLRQVSPAPLICQHGAQKTQHLFKFGQVCDVRFVHCNGISLVQVHFYFVLFYFIFFFKLRWGAGTEMGNLKQQFLIMRPFGTELGVSGFVARGVRDLLQIDGKPLAEVRGGSVLALQGGKTGVHQFFSFCTLSLLNAPITLK